MTEFKKITIKFCEYDLQDEASARRVAKLLHIMTENVMERWSKRQPVSTESWAAKVIPMSQSLIDHAEAQSNDPMRLVQKWIFEPPHKQPIAAGNFLSVTNNTQQPFISRQRNAQQSALNEQQQLDYYNLSTLTSGDSSGWPTFQEFVEAARSISTDSAVFTVMHLIYLYGLVQMIRRARMTPTSVLLFNFSMLAISYFLAGRLYRTFVWSGGEIAEIEFPYYLIAAGRFIRPVIDLEWLIQSAAQLTGRRLREGLLVLDVALFIASSVLYLGIEWLVDAPRTALRSAMAFSVQDQNVEITRALRQQTANQQRLFNLLEQKVKDGTANDRDYQLLQQVSMGTLQPVRAITLEPNEPLRAVQLLIDRRDSPTSLRRTVQRQLEQLNQTREQLAITDNDEDDVKTADPLDVDEWGFVDLHQIRKLAVMQREANSYRPFLPKLKAGLEKSKFFDEPLDKTRQIGSYDFSPIGLPIEQINDLDQRTAVLVMNIYIERGLSGCHNRAVRESGDEPDGWIPDSGREFLQFDNGLWSIADEYKEYATWLVVYGMAYSFFTTQNAARS